MADGDLYLVTCQGVFRSQQIVNTYTYVQRLNETPLMPNAFSLAAAFELAFMGSAGIGLRNAWISNQTSWNSIRVQNLFSPVDYSEILLEAGTAGTATGEALPNYAAYSFRTGWLGGVVRRGFKRIAGVPITANNNGTVASAAVVTMEALGVIMSTTLNADDKDFVPCVVKRIPYVTSEGNDAYRLPENAGEAVFVENVTFQLQTTLTTQNSRKIGRGA